MFTGIVQSTGILLESTKHHLIIKAPEISGDLKKGSSIAVDGACLTVTNVSDLGFTAEIMPETLAKTNLGLKNPNDKLNLELALPANGRFEGHIVTGHIEGIAGIISIEEDANSHILSINIPNELSKYIVTKGSITINGISLTVISIEGNVVKIGIIPYTWEFTNLNVLVAGDMVNIETDIIAKYIEKLRI